MLQSMKAKGQEEIAAFFSVLIFAAVFLTIVIFLSFTSGSVKQEVASEFKDTDLQEALLVYMKSPTQDGRVVNNISSSANSGGNKTNYNTKVDGGVSSGNAKTTTFVDTWANTSVITINQ